MINLIWAMDLNWLIGVNNELPWNYKEDLNYFKEITREKNVIMGRKTFDSIYNKLNKPLPNRKNFVITKNKVEIDGVYLVNDIDYFIRNLDFEIYVIGGSEIYKEFIKYADKLYITHINKEYVGDTYFPKFDLSKFKLISEKKNKNLSFNVYERR